jgi:hypothetical protein
MVGNLLAAVRHPYHRSTTTIAEQSLGNGRRLSLQHQPITTGTLPGLDLWQVDLLTQLSKPVLN